MLNYFWLVLDLLCLLLAFSGELSAYATDV